jgi:PAS domain S-box-containing protein
VNAPGTIIPIEINATVLRSGDAVQILTLCRDITERKRAEEAFAESESFNRGLVENLPDYIAIYGVDGKLLYVNPASATLLGYSAEKLVGTPVLSYVAEEYRDEVVSRITDRREGGEVPPYEIDLLTHGGLRRSAIVKGTQIQYRDTPATLLVLTDITNRKLAEDALRQANKQLNLLSSITRHDILNQLMALKGYLELSREYLGDKKILGDFLEKEEKSARTIEHQITFTKDYQELGATAPAWQNVNEDIRKAMAALPMRDVRVESDPADPEVYADPLFEKVFYNLIDNALRYGGDQLKTIRVSSQESGQGLLIVCEDDGVGITAEDKKRLFTRGFGKNTGLGLFFSREILSITGITIAENGIPGKGARFEITVPTGVWRMRGVHE